MRRLFSGSLALAVVVGLLFTTGCQRKGALQIVEINEGVPLRSDIIDFGTVRVEEEEESYEVLIWQYPADNVEIELLYTEIGLGLPTWTPYRAHLDEIRIQYEDAGVRAGEPRAYREVLLPIDVSVETDPDGRSTAKTSFTVIPSQWKEDHFRDEAQEDPIDPEEYLTVATLKAKLKVKGVDDATGRNVEAEAEFEIEVGNYWDDIARLDQ